MKYVGKLYRPWMEVNSLLIQITIGCSHNECSFCDMYSDKPKFKVRKLEDIYQDIEEARRINPYIENFFLVDGNVMVIKATHLIKVLAKIKELFPESKNIALYSQYNDFRRKTVEELKSIKAAGLTKAYVGLESGDAKVLADTTTGMTPEQAIIGASKAKEAGIRVLASFIFGLGGRHRSKEHISETTRLLNTIQPEEIAPMALAIQPGTSLAKEVERGEFIQATPLQILQEEKYLLENLNYKTVYWGDHGNNIVSNKGELPDMQEFFLEKVQHAIEKHPIVNEEVLHANPW
ncbi:radical SAM protein [Reichenbachiella versicolor]|uniref:radical SAM protein n=1 Tax=Reichenbachiella versicolor TaxID=1821036 RepID=UPI000D6E6BDD|nr:radical SAM protein [Reichenbachiella versicolor]